MELLETPVPQYTTGTGLLLVVLPVQQNNTSKSRLQRSTGVLY